MPNTAVLWIRDGVLVDRMHINPVAFAFAAWVFAAPAKREATSLEDLINFGFEKSGSSCADKMRMYNNEREEIIVDVEAGAGYYNTLATEAATAAEYFSGAPQLLKDLQNAGVQNFITSAVEQDVLDTWSKTKQGSVIAPYLKEILGKRQKFSKGRDHFDYVSTVLGNQEIYYVADATAEISTGREYSQEFKIAPIGFGNVITVERVLEAVELVSKALTVCLTDSIPFPVASDGIHIDSARLSLPAERAIKISLRQAGAEAVVTGTRERLVQNLRGYFEERSVLQSLTV